MEHVNWTPERRVVGGAIAVLVVTVLQIVFPDIDLPVGVEGAIGIIATFLVPNKG